MKFVLILAALLCSSLAAPVVRPFKGRRFPIIPIVLIDASTAQGGAGGDGGDAQAIGAIVTGGIGGAGVAGSGDVFNKGIIEGGAGVFSGNVANGAAGTVIGRGSISGSFQNAAVAGNGGAGGAASS
ncbi:hypothetical protein FGB62_320g019 [Gracilaria domingensis]|nr:hypothetical protein FGB62_320g019 [Gracilaria domingensis]